jgi:RNA polymerase sigma-70 factor (ECF subfamily)
LRRRLAHRRATDRLEMKMTAEFNDKMRRLLVKPTTFDLCELLFTKILLLPELQQEVVQLTFFKGLSQREIAAEKSISLGTVKTRLQLARKKLLNQLLPIQNRI